MRLSYSNYKTYKDCPRQFYYQINRVPPPYPPSKYFALYGILIQMFFEYYVKYYIREVPDFTPEVIKGLLRRLWKKVLDRNHVVWDDPWVKYSSVDIFELVYQDALEVLKKFDFWSNCISEKKYVINLKKSGDELVAKIDFIHHCPDGTIEILDGKGTDKVGKNVDVEQLYFYALAYLLHHRKLPDKIGFLYFKLRLIDYIDFTMDDIIKFKNKLALVKKTIKEDKEFKPNVKLSKHCKWCAWQTMCDEFNQKKQANRRKRSSIKEDSNGEVIDIGF